MNEAELLAQYKETGDLEVLGKLYTPYMSLIYGVCLKYLCEESKSQDAVMQIFEELIMKLRVHEVSSFKGWLYVYARNFCLMQLRKNKQVSWVNIEEHLSETERSIEQDALVWSDSDLDNLQGCIAGLKMEQQICVRLFYLEQKCYKEIADLTGFELNKVKSHIQNGKRNLKICIEQKNGQ